jgi:hypothetical protein
MQKISKEDVTILTPKQETVDILGDISYGESNGAWSIIRLKADFLKEFPQLKEKRAKFIYNMLMHRNYKDLKKAIGDIEKEGSTIPILLFLCKRKGEID